MFINIVLTIRLADLIICTHLTPASSSDVIPKGSIFMLSSPGQPCPASLFKPPDIFIASYLPINLLI